MTFREYHYEFISKQIEDVKGFLEKLESLTGKHFSNFSFLADSWKKDWYRKNESEIKNEVREWKRDTVIRCGLNPDDDDIKVLLNGKKQ